MRARRAEEKPGANGMDKPKPTIRHFDTCNAIGLDDLEAIIESSDHVTSEFCYCDKAWSVGELDRSYIVKRRLLCGVHFHFLLDDQK